MNVTDYHPVNRETTALAGKIIYYLYLHRFKFTKELLQWILLFFSLVPFSRRFLKNTKYYLHYNPKKDIYVQWSV